MRAPTLLLISGLALELAGCNCGDDPTGLSLAVSPAASALVVGATVQLTATITDERGKSVAGVPTWSTADARVASVDSAGLVTANAPGGTTLRANFKGASGSAQVTVTARPGATLSVVPASATLAVGEALTLRAVLTDAQGSAVDTAATWASDAVGLARVDDAGHVVGVAPGAVKISATAGGATASAQLTVVAAGAKGLTCFEPSVFAVGSSNPRFTVYGAGFTAGSTVQLDGVPAFTTFNGPTLGCVLAASDVAQPRVAQVTVVTPGPDGGTSNALPLAVRAEPAGAPLLVSAALDGGGSNNALTGLAAVSGDGRYVLFTSNATNLQPGIVEATNQQDLWWRDTCRGASGACTPQTRLMSTGDGGHVTGARTADFPALSASGRYAAFVAGALRPQEPNRGNVYLRDTCAGAGPGCSESLTLISLAPDGGAADDDGREVAISASGRFVAFVSRAANLAPGNAGDVFLRDTCAGASGCVPRTVRVSVALDGGAADQGSAFPSVSADGRYVAFGSHASNLVAEANVSGENLFLRDTCLGAPASCAPSTLWLSVAVDGGQPNNGSFFPAVSADGRYVAFQSSASNLVADDTSAEDDIYFADTCAGAAGCVRSLRLVSRSTCGVQLTEAARYPSLSADGRYVGFQTYDTRNAYAAVRDTCTGESACTPATMIFSRPAGGVLPVVCPAGGCFLYGEVTGATGQLYLEPTFLLP